MEICRRTSTAVTQLGSELSSEGRSRNGSDRKTEMCSIFDVYDKCVRKGVKNDCKGDQVMMNRERDAARVCGGPHSGLSTTQHQSPPRGLVIALLTPTSVP